MADFLSIYLLLLFELYAGTTITQNNYGVEWSPTAGLCFYW